MQRWWQGRGCHYMLENYHSLLCVVSLSCMWETSGVRTLDIETCKSKLTMTIDQDRHKDIGFRLQSTTCTIHHFTFFTFWDIEDIRHISSTYASSQVTTITTSSGCYLKRLVKPQTLSVVWSEPHRMSDSSCIRLTWSAYTPQITRSPSPYFRSDTGWVTLPARISTLSANFMVFESLCHYFLADLIANGRGQPQFLFFKKQKWQELAREIEGSVF